MKNNYNLRSIAAKAIGQVLDQGQSLSTVLPALQTSISDKDRGLLQELCFGTLRVLPQLEWCIQQLMAKPLTGKQRTLHYLLMVGLYQLLYTRIPAHAVLAETVEGAVALKRPQLKGLINGVLRQFQRQQEELLQRASNNDSRYLHPSWLLKRIQQAYPANWEQIVDANNQKPPMWLRVNRLHHTRDAYLQLLSDAGIAAETHSDYADAVRLLAPCAVTDLPGFAEGWVTVQDASAQGCVDSLIRKTANRSSTCAPHPAAKPRIFWKRRRKRTSWRSISTNSAWRESKRTCSVCVCTQRLNWAMAALRSSGAGTNRSIVSCWTRLVPPPA